MSYSDEEVLPVCDDDVYDEEEAKMNYIPTQYAMDVVKYDEDIVCPPRSMWKMDPIYGNDAKGALRSWEISFDGKALSIVHGHVGGKMQTDMVVIIAKSKRTINEQAWLEALKRYKDKVVGNGYRLDGESEKATSFSVDAKVMCAHHYEPGKTKLKFPVSVSRKYDGVRFIAYLKNGKVILRSRKNIEFTGLHHIRAELSYIFDQNPTLVIDGELYIHGKMLQEIRGIVNTSTHEHPEAIDVSAYIFDLILEEVEYVERLNMMEEMEEKYKRVFKSIIFIPTWEVYSDSQIEKLHDDFVRDGYEGCMIRNYFAFYQKKRTNDLLKYKKFDEEEGTIIDVVGARTIGGREEDLAIFRIMRDSGVEFNCRPRGSFDLRRKWFNDRGKILYNEDGTLANRRYTFRYFGNNKDGTPNIATGICFRDYEGEGDRIYMEE